VTIGRFSYTRISTTLTDAIGVKIAGNWLIYFADFFWRPFDRPRNYV